MVVRRFLKRLRDARTKADSSGPGSVPKVRPPANAGKEDRRQPADNRRQREPWTPDQFQVPQEFGKTRFADLDIPVSILHATADLDFRYCTPVQAHTLPVALVGKDIAGQAQTGTGKTAAFLIAAFARFLKNKPAGDRKPGTPRALVLAPTRELVAQILKDGNALTRHCRLHCEAVFGGMDFEKQLNALHARPVDLLVATPGRLLDFQRRGRLDLRHVEVLVLDEADRMLDMGFIPDVRRIIRSLPPREKRQTMLFSATLSSDVMRLAAQWMVDPVRIDIEPEQVTVSTVDQIAVAVTSRDRGSLLVKLLRRPDAQRVLVFVNRRDMADRVTKSLQRARVHCGLISGAMPQNKRMRILEDFREGRIKALIATDVAARGIHIDDVSHVVNYDVPYEPESYVHRIGRTARVGKTGKAIMFACEREAFSIPAIEELTGKPLRWVTPEELLA